MKRKLIILLACCFAVVHNLTANEAISFTWQGAQYGKGFYITATNGKQFTINWGDGSAIVTKTGTGGSQVIIPTYTNTGIYTVSITGTTIDCLFTAFDCSSSLVGFVNQITNLDVSACKSLLVLNCAGNQLSNLDISECKALINLNLSSNQLTSLDLSSNLVLQQLNCSYNSLIDLNISANTALTVVNFGRNQLAVIDLSTNLALQHLDCSYNQISDLELLVNTALEELYCYNNLLTNLDISSNTALKYLHCRDNFLTNIDLSKNLALERLYCHSNQITNLDLSKNTALIYLYTSDNPLTYLDVSSNTALQYLECSNNSLTDLDLTTNTALFYLQCLNNHLHLSNLYNFSQKISEKYWKWLGTQTLVKQTVVVGEAIDFSEQKEFGSISTIFSVEKNGLPAHSSDYTETNGIITFFNVGNYTVTMTNSAIISNPYYPAKVIANFEVILAGGVGIAEILANSISIYPNPTKAELRIESGDLRVEKVEILDISGKIVLASHETSINISQLSAGIYFVKLKTEIGELTKKVIKE